MYRNNLKKQHVVYFVTIKFYENLIYPTENRQECKYYGSNNIGLENGEHLIGLPPGIRHVDESDGVK